MKLLLLLPLLSFLLITGCASYLYLPKLAKEDATVIVRCSDSGSSKQLLVVLLDHTKDMTQDQVQRKKQMQKIAEIEVDADCHFVVRAPKTPMELSTNP